MIFRLISILSHLTSGLIQMIRKMERSSCTMINGKTNLVLSSWMLIFQRIGLACVSNLHGLNLIVVVFLSNINSHFWKDSLRIHNSCWLQCKIPTWCSQWLKSVVVSQLSTIRMLTSTRTIHSLINLSMELWLFSNLTIKMLDRINIKMEVSTLNSLIKTILSIVHRSNVKERTQVECFLRKVTSTSLCALLKTQRLGVSSSSRCTSTRPCVMLTSRECSIQMISTRPKIRFFHTLFLRRRKRWWTKHQFGKSNLSKSPWNTWWPMKIQVSTSEELAFSVIYAL